MRIAVGFEALTGLLPEFKSALGSAGYRQIEWQFSGDRVGAMGVSHWGVCRTAALNWTVCWTRASIHKRSTLGFKLISAAFLTVF